MFIKIMTVTSLVKATSKNYEVMDIKKLIMIITLRRLVKTKADESDNIAF